MHCDPHAGNVLVRAVPQRVMSGLGIRTRLQPQVVLLDHGLYRQLSDEFRLEYARLWRGLVFGNAAEIRQSAEALGAGPLYPLFASMLTMRSWDKIVGEPLPPSGTANIALDSPPHQVPLPPAPTDGHPPADPTVVAVNARQEAAALLLRDTGTEREKTKMYARMYASEITTILSQVSREVLLLLKTNDCLRAVNARLGSPVNTFLITARHCVETLARADLEQRGHTLSARVRYLLAKLRLELQLAVINALAMWQLMGVSRQAHAVWVGGQAGVH